MSHFSLSLEMFLRHVISRHELVTEGIDVHALLGQELVLGWLVAQALR
jgi:hypothetical protein